LRKDEARTLGKVASLVKEGEGDSSWEKTQQRQDHVGLGQEQSQLEGGGKAGYFIPSPGESLEKRKKKEEEKIKGEKGKKGCPARANS